MALTVCDECDGQISSSATTCPHCGYPILRKRLAGEVKAASRSALSALRGLPPKYASGLSDDKLHLLVTRMGKPSPPWSLTRINGCGLHLGKPIPVARDEGHLIAVARLYFTLLFIPLVPLGWHVVRVLDESSNLVGQRLGSYQFIGRLDGATCSELFGGKVGARGVFSEFARGTWTIIVIALIVLMVTALARSIL